MSERKINVLMIEDDDDDFFLTSELLHETGGRYEVAWERDGASGVEALATGAFDICLLDFRLGAVTGLELLEQVHARGVETPIILLTGQDDRDTDLAAMRAGAADYLVKGAIDGQTLERSIRYAIERSDSTRSLAESEEQFRSVIESAFDPIALTDDNGQLTSWNPSFQRVFGYTAEQVRGHSLLDFIFDEDGERAATAMSDLTRTPGGGRDLHARCADGRMLRVEVSVSSWSSGDSRTWSAIVRDVTAARDLEDQLEYQAFHDPLTGLANRSLLHDRLAQALARIARVPATLGVLFLDLDDFKRVNDTQGHAIGDELLRIVAERVNQSVRTTDTAARFGGDEFAIVVDGATDAPGVVRVAQRVLDSLTVPIPVAGVEVLVSASIGVVIVEDATQSAAALLRNADVAMYAAKERGKNRYTVYESSMHTRLLERIELERQLRTALDDGGITAHYQPIINLATGGVRGVEALARWSDAERGDVPPGVFIPVAEDTGLIVDLGRRVLECAAAQVAEWQQRFPSASTLTLSVNASPREIESAGFVAAVRAALETSGLPSASLIIEVTESVMAVDLDTVVARLQELRDLGVRVAIDDFGTGYSSLSIVSELPLEILKIDRSFVARLTSQHDEDALLSAIVAMSRSLGLQTVAEGIEDTTQLAALKGLGCDFGQGYLFARPAPAHVISALLEAAERDAA